MITVTIQLMTVDNMEMAVKMQGRLVESQFATDISKRAMVTVVIQLCSFVRMKYIMTQFATCSGVRRRSLSSFTQWCNQFSAFWQLYLTGCDGWLCSKRRLSTDTILIRYEANIGFHHLLTILMTYSNISSTTSSILNYFRHSFGSSIGLTDSSFYAEFKYQVNRFIV